MESGEADVRGSVLRCELRPGGVRGVFGGES